MSTLQYDELVLDESDYTVDVDGTSTSYTSEKNGIAVEVNGRLITIRSTAQYQGEALPMVPPDE